MRRPVTIDPPVAIPPMDPPVIPPVMEPPVRYAVEVC